MTVAVLILLLSGAGSASQEVPAPQPLEQLDPRGVYDYDSPPRPLKLKKPKYPRKAFDDKVEGVVIVEILINPKGEVEDARILQSVPGLDDAALKCVKDWRFKPAIKAGKPVATIANAPIAFKIK